MRTHRLLIEGATYHVTSRVNRKDNAFSANVGQKIMLLTIEDAKDKYHFKLHNFCVMPNHIHLLLTPKEGTNLPRIIQWIKTKSAKRWNSSFNRQDHLWGERFFSRPIKNESDYVDVYNYIDQNPVKAGLVKQPHDWKGSGAYYIENRCDLVDIH
ncbi:MAG: transposase [Treponema sp.]|nr:transposase [Treponema sp.]